MALALMAPAANAQTKGVPASITSIGMGGKSFTPGVPASITSPGRAGFTCTNSALIPSALGCTNPYFTPSVNFTTGQVQFGQTSGVHSGHSGSGHPGHGQPGNGHHRRPNTGYGAVYVPYAYPVPYDYAQGTGEMVTEPEAAEPDPPAPTIFERRPTETYTQRSLVTANEYAPVTSAAQAEPAREAIPVVLVYKDGHEQEVRNYAIVGKTLYDLGTFVAHKIPLADLDLPATMKANDDRGVEFNLPSSVSMD